MDCESGSKKIGIFRCPFCDERYTNPTGLITHLHSHEFQPEIKSDQQSYSISNKKQKVVWNKSCCKCSQNFQTENALQRHISSVHDNKIVPIKIIKCSQCTLRFTSATQLNKHQRLTHGKAPRKNKSEVKYRCRFCPKLFSRHAMAYHVLIHTGEKPYKCLICSHKSRRKHHIQMHLEYVHREADPTSFSYVQPNQLDLSSVQDSMINATNQIFKEFKVNSLKDSVPLSPLQKRKQGKFVVNKPHFSANTTRQET